MALLLLEMIAAILDVYLFAVRVALFDAVSVEELFCIAFDHHFVHQVIPFKRERERQFRLVYCNILKLTL